MRRGAPCSLIICVLYYSIMETTYKLNARDLSSGFVASIKNVYLDRDIEITIRDINASTVETEYLMQSSANREMLLNAVKNIEEGKNLVTFESLENVIKYAGEQSSGD